MGIQIVEPRHTEYTYGLFFCRKGETGGFSFPCDIKGNIFTDKLEPIALESLRDCQDRTQFDPPVVHTYQNRVPATGRCGCGRLVSLDNPLDNPCDCGACYNMSGQQVTPSWECNEQGEPLAWQNDE